MQLDIEQKRKVKRRSIDCSEPVITDQSMKKLCDINNIVSKFMKTGVLPLGRQNPQYGDVSEIPSLEDAFEAVKLAQEAFYDLPADVRKDIDNDPSKLGLWLSDEANYEKAVKHGLLKAKPQEPVLPSDQYSDGSSANNPKGDSNASINN